MIIASPHSLGGSHTRLILSHIRSAALLYCIYKMQLSLILSATGVALPKKLLISPQTFKWLLKHISCSRRTTDTNPKLNFKFCVASLVRLVFELSNQLYICLFCCWLDISSQHSGLYFSTFEANDRLSLAFSFQVFCRSGFRGLSFFKKIYSSLLHEWHYTNPYNQPSTVVQFSLDVRGKRWT